MNCPYAPPVPRPLLDFIRSGSKFVVVGHLDPDGDCIGSQLALASALRRLEKQVTLASSGLFSYPAVAAYAPFFKSELSQADLAEARLLVVDCSSFERVGRVLPADSAALPLAVIDHHATDPRSFIDSCSAAYIEPDAPSCTVLVQAVIRALGLDFTPEERDALFFGLCTDTGFFRHVPENRPSAFFAAAELCGLGASPKAVYYKMNGGKSLASRLLTGRILSHAQAYFDGRLVVIVETVDDYEAFGREARDSDALYQQLMSVAGVEAVAFVKEEPLDDKPGECKVGLRSKDAVDVAAVAGILGGGGHKNAAGATVAGSINEVKKKVLEVFASSFTDLLPSHK